MTEYSKRIFSDPKALRQKLEIYLQTPEKVEIYAQTCEISFMKGANSTLAISAGWTWWGFFFTFAYLIYRKCYVEALIALAVSFALGPLVMIGMGMFGKYIVAKRFEKTLELENDEALRMLGGTNFWGQVIGAISIIPQALLFFTIITGFFAILLV